MKRKIKDNKNKNLLRQVVSRQNIMALAAIVVFVTTYALILPALTLEQDRASAEAGLDLGILEALTEGSAQVTESTEPAPADQTEPEPVDITEPPATEPAPTPEPSPAPVQEEPTPAPQETAPAETVAPAPAAPVLQPLPHPRKGAAADLLAEALDQLANVIIYGNTSGASLPYTGGAGTAGIYAAGLVLVSGAGLLLARRRRKAG